MMEFTAVITHKEIERFLKRELGIRCIAWQNNGLVVSIGMDKITKEEFHGEEFYREEDGKFTIVNKEKWIINV